MDYDKIRITRALPTNYRTGDFDFCKPEFSYTTNSIKIKSFENAIINGLGYLFTSNYHVLEDSVIKIEEFKSFQNLKRAVFRSKRKLKESNYVLCFDEWSSNHYHWICDFLPRLYCVKEFLQTHTLLLPDTNYIKNIGIPILKKVGLSPNNIEWLQPDEYVRAKNCVFVNRTVLTGRIHDALIQRLQTTLITTDNLNNTKPTKKIYVSRSKATYRKIVNEEAVKNLFLRYGFEEVYFEDLTIEHQISLCRQTSHIASIHGAGLTNTFFMQPGGNVLEFRRDRIYHNQCFWHLSTALSHRYYYFFGEPDSNKYIEGWDSCNLTISIDLLELELKNFLSIK